MGEVPMARGRWFEELEPRTVVRHALRHLFAPVLELVEREGASGRGAFSVDGQMVDEPMIRRARQTVAQAGDEDRRGERT